MKKLLLGALLLLSTLSFSQETIGTYQMSYLTSSEPYSVQASEPKNGNFSWYIMCAGETSSTQDSFIIVKNDKMSDFINYINFLEDVYIKWSDVATQNKLTSKTFKEITDTPSNDVSAGWKYGSYHFDYSVILSARFIVLDGGAKVLVIDTGSLQASDNQYIDSKGNMLVFSNKLEIENFKALLLEKTVLDFYTAKNKQKDLFKN